MFLIDTNVLACLLIEGERTAAAQALSRRDPDWRSEAFILVEFTNVLVRSVLVKRMKLDLAQNLLLKAEALLRGRLARVSHSEALALAMEHRITACDARFLTLARQLGHKLVTEDERLHAAAPDLTQSLVEAARLR
jgi:predicted nucleic acid-binding protein